MGSFSENSLLLGCQKKGDSSSSSSSGGEGAPCPLQRLLSHTSHGGTDPPTAAPRCWRSSRAPGAAGWAAVVQLWLFTERTWKEDSYPGGSPSAPLPSVEIPYPLWDGLLQVPSPRLTHSCRDLLFGPAWKTRAASGLLLHLHEGSSRTASATNLKGTLLG